MKNVNIENNADLPISPTWFTKNGDKSHTPLKEGQKTGYEYLSTGLTKREYFAAKAMQGIVSNQAFLKNLNADPDLVAASILEIADKLLEKLSSVSSSQS